MKALLALILLLLTLPVQARYVVVTKAVIPERQTWNYHGGFWEWHAREYVILFEPEEDDAGVTTYNAMIVSLEEWAGLADGTYYYIDSEEED